MSETRFGETISALEQRTGIRLYWAEKVVHPEAESADHVFDGKVKSIYPRILLPELSEWSGYGVSNFIERRLDAYQNKKSQYQDQCDQNVLLSLVICWIASGSLDEAISLAEEQRNFQLNQPKASGQVSNGWELALAYDLSEPVLSSEDKKLIEPKIVQALKDTLVILDENSASLWHTRSSHAAVAWLLAVVLPENLEGAELLRTRAQGHFLNTINALSYTEIWPEGYNYWVQNRAFLIALASSAYLNGLEGSNQGTEIRELMRRVGYWHIYATRPDNRIEGYGDEGSRVDLKDETRRAIDLIVKMTQDPVLAGYSQYLAKLHGAASYYPGYRWGFLLFHDPFVTALGDGTLASLGTYLQNSELYGKNSTNYAYLRSGWKPDDTFITFKAGHSFTHHSHYDAGHFTLFKGAPLAINSSTYGDYTSENRLNYSIRTVSKNSLLILKPEEKVKPNRFFENNVADGGQRIVLPTGSAIKSLGNWFDNYQRGQHFEGAELLSYDFRQDQYHYMSTDLTPAYNNTAYDENGEGGKVQKVIRDFLYLPDEDHLIIYDRVHSTDLGYTKKWLLHTVTRPKVTDQNVLKGSIDNGISESRSDVVNIQNKNGHLKVTRILPEDSLFRIVGGPDFQYYVETDGDDTDLDGVNYHQGSANKPWFDVGMWRLELQPGMPAEFNEFLVVLSPSIERPRYDPVRKINVTSGNASGVVTSNSAIVFVSNKGRLRELILELPAGNRRLILIGITASSTIKVEQNGKVLGSIVSAKTLTDLRIKIDSTSPVKINW